MQLANVKKSASSTAASAKSFFPADRSQASNNDEKTSFFRPTAPQTVQTKCSECESDNRKTNSKEVHSASNVVQRISSLKDGEKNIATASLQRTLSSPGSSTPAALAFAPTSGTSNRALAKLFRSVSSGGSISGNLTISSPTDPAELEAERIAAEVMRMPEDASPQSIGSSSPALNRKCAACDDEEKIHRFATGESPGTAPHIVNQVLSQPGQPLPDSTRSFFEPRLGADLSAVRVHTGSQAARSANAVHAKAYTVGNSIAFAEGQYAPQSESGKGLLAHELVHVVQGPSGARTDPSPENSKSLTAATSVISSQNTHELTRWPWSDDKPKTNREFVDTAFQSRKPGDVNDIPFAAYATASSLEKLDLLRILLSRDTNWYVGPINQIAAKELWRSLGSAALTLGAEAAPLWKLSVERGVGLADLPVVQDFIAEFRVKAIAMATVVLEKSRLRVLAEQQRYGLTSTTTTDIVDGPGGSTRSIRTTQNTMASNPDSKNVAAAAGDLATRIARIRPMQSEQRSLVREASTIEPGRQVVTDQARFDQLGAQIREEARAYDVARNDASMNYPILAGFAERKDQAGLEQIAEGAQGGAADALNTGIAEKLSNIARVEEALKDDSSNLIWELDNVIEITREGMGIVPNSIHDGFLATRTAAASSDEMLRGIAIGLLALGLGLLTMGAGAVAVAGAAGSFALSSYIAYESFKDYQLKSAATGSDFDKAHSVSMEEPSLFWLAMDIIAVVFELSAARAVFRTIRTVPREAEAMARAARATEGGEPLARRIIEHAPERASAASAAANANKSEAAARLLLSPEQFEAELRGVSRNKPKLLESGNYDLEIVGDKHTFRRRKIDGGWCMFSDPRCPDKEILDHFEELNRHSQFHPLRVDTGFNPTGLKSEDIRRLPGVARGNGGPVVTSLFSEGGMQGGRALDGRITRFPGQIAAKLKTMGQFRDFNHFRSEFWKLVRQDAGLSAGWGEKSLARMEKGQPPFVGDRFLSKEFRSANEKGISNLVYQIDHMDDLALSGVDGLYNMDRLQIVTAEVNQSFNKPF